ncbi:MAG: hypothetical protein J5860_02120, partial [Clostridia bacterium]|nr:hypothetical protein [Clostridia bacterium]
EKNGRYNFYDELYALKNSITYYDDERSLYDLGNLVGALSVPQAESDNLDDRQLERLENAYTQCALRIKSVLEDPEEKCDVMYGVYTSSMIRHASLGYTRDIHGNIIVPDETGTFALRPTCLNFFFGGELLSDDKWYLEDVQTVIENMPEGKVKQFLVKNRIAVAYYSMITLLGSTISDLLQSGEEDISYENAKDYLARMNSRWVGYFAALMSTLVDGGEFASESDVEEYFSAIFDQQAAEAVSKDKVTVRVIDDGDDSASYQVRVSDSSAQALMSIYSTKNVKLKVTESENFPMFSHTVFGDRPIEELYPDGIYFDLEKTEGELDIADYYDSITDSTQDIYRRIFSSKTSTWTVDAPEPVCFVLYDENGIPHICDIKYSDSSKEKAYIPIAVVDPESDISWSIFVYISKDEDGWKIDGFASYSDNFGQRVYDTLSDERFSGYYYAPATMFRDSVYSALYNVPTSTLMEINVEKEDWGISFGYEPISNIEDIESYETRYYVEDVYKHNVDITDAFLSADETAEQGNVVLTLDDAEITITDPVYNGEEQRPDVSVTVSGKTLEQGKDFKVIYDGSIDRGKAYVAVMGIGDYVGTVYGEYTILCTEHRYAPTTDIHASCTEDGYKEYTCSICGHQYRDIVKSTGHVMTYHTAKKATKNSDGYIAHWTCDRCGKYFTDEAGINETTPEKIVRTYFKYVHDPKQNPKAMSDIVEDENAVYGFRPSDNGSLKDYASYDWTDPEVVERGRQERIEYHKSLETMYELLETMRAEGKSTEEIARAVSAKRNELRLAAYENDPEGLAVVKARNLEKFGHEEGPLADEVYAETGSWEMVIAKAFTANSGMDACLGLYDDYY